jgi:hypothetical protein
MARNLIRDKSMLVGAGGRRKRTRGGRLRQGRARARSLDVQLLLAFVMWQRSCCVSWPSQAVAEGGERWRRPGEATKQRGESPLQ